jgi:hyperosmotically inducible periplasmic protein
MTNAMTRSICPSYCAMVAAAFMLGLTACGQEPAPKVAATKSGPTTSANPGTAPKAAAPEAAPAEKKASASDSDRALARRVKDALIGRADLKAHGIDITADQGVVTLFGTADSLANRKLAGDIASGIDGVRSVENRLVVASGS